MVQITGFFNFIFSDFLLAYSKSINLHLPMLIVLKIMTIMYMILKYPSVLIQALFENTNVNLVKSASNIFATKRLMSCDNSTPRPSPTPKDTNPIRSVSINRIIEIFRLLIPSVR